MSPRAACRLETLGYRQVYDYLPGKVDWLAHGLATEGDVSQEPRAIDALRRDVVTCGLAGPAADVRDLLAPSPWGFAFVVSDGGILLGRLRKAALDGHPDARAEAIMDPGPSTVRAHLPLREALERMRRHGLLALVVTGPDGRLLGVVRRLDAETRLAQKGV